jgi:uncharacterized protein
MQNKPQRVVLAGGSGFLGTRLAEELAARNYDVVILTRKPRRSGSVRELAWDGQSLAEWATELDGASAVVNLAGRSVNCRYTPENRRDINESRVQSTNVIGAAIARCFLPPPVWVQASSLALYGDTGERLCDESTPPGEGLPVETCLLWERAFNDAVTPRTRKVALRIGFALDAGGGALSTLARLVRCFLGGTVGNGRQYISWIHWRDLNAMFLWALERNNLSGVFNATAPNPVTNAEFMRELRRVLHRPWTPPAPAPLVHIGSWLMRTEPSLALTGRRCAPRRFLGSGFPFAFNDLRLALADIYQR